MKGSSSEKPHVADLVLKHQQALILKLRHLAKVFENLWERRASSSRNVSLDALEEYQFTEEAGLCLIDGCERGLISLPGLRELVDRIMNLPMDSRPRKQATLVPSPANVFIELVGNNEILVRIDKRKGKVEIIGDAHAGLLPEQLPTVFPEAQFLSAAAKGAPLAAELHLRDGILKKALACRVLAEFMRKCPATGYDPDAYMPVKDALDQWNEQAASLDYNHFGKARKANPWMRFDPHAKKNRPRVHRGDWAKFLKGPIHPRSFELLDKDDHPSIAETLTDEYVADAFARGVEIRNEKRRMGK